MATGDTDDILTRVKMLIPFRWFSWVAPLRDAILGGLSDGGAWCYAWIVYAKQQSRIATSTGPFLDLISYDFLGRHLPRGHMTDDQFRVRIMATILQERVTRAGVSNAIKQLTGVAPWIFEPWNTGDAGSWADAATPSSHPFSAFAWADVNGLSGAGGWGSTDLPAQTYMVVTRTAFSGVPLVAGWSGTAVGQRIGAGAWIGTAAPPYQNVGIIELFGTGTSQSGVTDDLIYDTIDTTRPTGSIAWTRIQ